MLSKLEFIPTEAAALWASPDISMDPPNTHSSHLSLSPPPLAHLAPILPLSDPGSWAIHLPVDIVALTLISWISIKDFTGLASTDLNSSVVNHLFILYIRVSFLLGSIPL